LFGCGKLAESFWPTKHEYGKRGEPSRSLPGRNILFAELAQQVNGGRVKPVRQRKQFWTHSSPAAPGFLLAAMAGAGA